MKSLRLDWNAKRLSTLRTWTLMRNPHRSAGGFRPDVDFSGGRGLLPALRIYQFHCGRDARAPREKTRCLVDHHSIQGSR